MVHRPAYVYNGTGWDEVGDSRVSSKADADKFNVPATNELALRPDGSTEAVRIDSAGNVGIGTTSPDEKVHVVESGTDDAVVVIHQSKYNDATVNAALEFRGWPSSPAGKIVSDRESPYNETTFSRDSNMLFYTANNNADVERLRITREGAVLIGTTTPGSAGAGDLVVAGGVFLGGSAAANELDDYEEGTWTPTYEPQTGTFGSITYDSETTGTYTKIGRLVVAHFRIMTDAFSIGTASGILHISGVPFTAVNTGAVDRAGAVTWNINNFTSNPYGAYMLNGEARMRVTTNSIGQSANVSILDTGANDNILSGYIVYNAA